jgi:TPR repeat protein
LGLLYSSLNEEENEYGIEKNDEKAIKLFEESFELGINDSLFNLGLIYEKINIKKSIDYYLKSSNLGKELYYSNPKKREFIINV